MNKQTGLFESKIQLLNAAGIKTGAIAALIVGILSIGGNQQTTINENGRLLTDEEVQYFKKDALISVCPDLERKLETDKTNSVEFGVKCEDYVVQKLL